MPNGPSNAAPWWVTAAGVVGVPSAIALYLVYWLTGAAAREMTEHSSLIRTQMEAVRQDLTVSATDHAQIVDARLTSIMRMLQRICVNTASSMDERAACFDQRAIGTAFSWRDPNGEP